MNQRLDNVWAGFERVHHGRNLHEIRSSAHDVNYFHSLSDDIHLNLNYEISLSDFRGGGPFLAALSQGAGVGVVTSFNWGRNARFSVVSPAQISTSLSGCRLRYQHGLKP